MDVHGLQAAEFSYERSQFSAASNDRRHRRDEEGHPKIFTLLHLKLIFHQIPLVG